MVGHRGQHGGAIILAGREIPYLRSRAGSEMGGHRGGFENRANVDPFQSSGQYLLLVIEEQSLVESTGAPEVFGTNRHAGALNVGNSTAIPIDGGLWRNVPFQKHLVQRRRQAHFSENRQGSGPEARPRLIKS